MKCARILFVNAESDYRLLHGEVKSDEIRRDLEALMRVYVILK